MSIIIFLLLDIKLAVILEMYIISMFIILVMIIFMIFYL